MPQPRTICPGLKEIGDRFDGRTSRNYYHVFSDNPFAYMTGKVPHEANGRCHRRLDQTEV